MVVLVDTNGVINFHTTRELVYEASSEVIMKCASEEKSVNDDPVTRQ